MWETDSPFQVEQHRYEESLALIRDHATFLTNAANGPFSDRLVPCYYFRVDISPIKLLAGVNRFS